MCRKSIFILFVQISILIIDAESQVLKWDWAKRYGSELGVTLKDCSIDSLGNYYVTGSFGGSLDLETSILYSQGRSNIYILKFDKNGSLIYTKSFGGNFIDEAYGVYPDKNGDVIVTGYFNSDSILFDNIMLYNNNDYRKMFILKLNNKGDVLWGRSSSGTSSNKGDYVASDREGNSYVVGTFKYSSLIFDTIVVQPTNIYEIPDCELHDTIDIQDYFGQGLFIVKFDPGGNAIWSKGISGEVIGRDLAIDKNNNIYVLGDFQNCAVVVCDSIIYNSGTDDILYVKLDEDGNLIQTFSLGGNSQDRGTAVNIDDSLNVIFSAHFISDSIQIGSEYFYPYRRSDAISPASVLVSLELNGNIKWIVRHPGITADLAMDKSGFIYEIGSINYDIDFNGYNLSVNGSQDIYIAKYI